MSSQTPPELRVLCRKLSSTPSTQLLHSTPSLVNHVLRCKQPLSAPQDSRAKGEAAENAMLVSKLKKSVATLLSSRTREERLAAIPLIKAMVDVGGWEVLRGSEPWVRGMLSIIQKSDPLPMKELAIVALTRIYLLLQPYQTLVREIVTPTLPAFATACLQLIKLSSPDQVPTTPFGITETICDAFSTLTPLYPATLRPSSSQIQAAIRIYLAPTESDSLTVPVSLKLAARRLASTQHFVAAKSGGSDEWAKIVDGILAELHATADQVFRAVDESWEPTTDSSRPKVQIDQELSGGGSGPGQLPAWRGIQAGSQRLAGLFDYLGSVLCHSTKGPVTVPLTKAMDAVARVCLIARLSPKTQTWDQALQTTPSVGREEKDELWSVVPDIHMAALRLIEAMLQQLGDDMRPYASEALEHLVRVFNSGSSLPGIRSTSYVTINRILAVAGPTLPKPSVDMLQPVMGATCRDLQEDAGHFNQSKKLPGSATGTKKNSLAANADLFLQQPQSAADSHPPSLDSAHRSAAEALIANLLSNVEQKHLKPSLRGLLDQTAIVTRNRDAMIASVLHPYIDPRGRRYPSILPHLMREFPNDKSVEILQTHLRADGRAASRQPTPMSEDEESAADEEMAEAEDDAAGDNGNTAETEDNLVKEDALSAETKTELPVQNNPFESNQTGTPAASNGFGDIQPRESSPPKRKHEEPAARVPPKRQELDRQVEVAAPVQPVGTTKPPATEQDQDDDDSDESVHLNMELEDDDDDDED